MKKHLLKAFFDKMLHYPFSVQFWDGEECHYNKGTPTFTILFHQPLPVSADLADPIMAFGEAYMDGLIDFKGNFDDLIHLLVHNGLLGSSNKKNIFAKAAEAIQPTGKTEEQKNNVQHHYDLGNDFFSRWLDDTMSYSCGYFRHPTDSLQQAQVQKIDHSLKKMQLKPGEHILDIGSGWGWLLIHAARDYGVFATGVTLSEEQYEATIQRIIDFELQDLVDVKLINYLDLKENEKYDKVVSIGMFEHVGKENLPVYMEKVEKLLKPGGLSLLHSIMGPREAAVNSWIRRYIFPGGYIPSLREIISLLPDYDFHLLHAESLRLHYAKTLDHWLHNYLKEWDWVVSKYGERFARMWKLYLTACAANFRASGLNIYQLAFTKGLNNSLESTIEHVLCSSEQADE
ncbi:MAG: class I SAM-dependent methyltransferase [Tindallia sp. MSAO_Bac2]|nr:MAG: class I SAM-dependent methyltransferase [Tindallia sp. MSAO_Bac2]